MASALVVLYLVAIIAANLISAHFGPKASVYNAFFLIGLNLTTRDKLHDLWGQNRFRNMAILILAGSVISYVATRVIGTGPPEIIARIALASCIAFAVAESFDAIIYQLVHRRPWIERANLSNFVGAAFDSMVFVTIAFGWDWTIIFAQFCAKVAGGFAWSFVLARVRSRDDVLVEAL